MQLNDKMKGEACQSNLRISVMTEIAVGKQLGERQINDARDAHWRKDVCSDASNKFKDVRRALSWHLMKTEMLMNAGSHVFRMKLRSCSSYR